MPEYIVHPPQQMRCATCGMPWVSSHVCPISVTAQPMQGIFPLPPQRPQRQDALLMQLRDLHTLAARYGLYDAADWLWKRIATSSDFAGTATGADT